MRRGLPFFVALLMLAATAAAQPRFRSGTDVTAVDVAVVDDDGRPIRDLTPADFIVRIGGTPRRVLSADWLSSTARPGAAAEPAVEGFTSNADAGGGRLIVLAVDEAGLPFGSGRAVLAAASRFLTALPPGDRVAVAGIGQGGQGVGFTTDRARIARAVAQVTGRTTLRPENRHHLSLREATGVEAMGDGAAADAIRRECEGLTGRQREACEQEVLEDARELAVVMRQQSRQFVLGLRQLLTGLSAIDAPKTLVLISNGFIPDDPASDAFEIARAAAAARTTIYALQLDRTFVDISDTRPPVDPYGDRAERVEGLVTLAATTRGALFVVSGDGTGVFRRLERELAGYYLIGVESDPRDRDGKPHVIDVQVTRRGVTVRARRHLIGGEPEHAALDPQQALVGALANPLPVAGLPLRVATFALAGVERDRVQVLIHAEVGRSYAERLPISIAFTITGADGSIVDTRLSRGMLAPAFGGIPSAAVYTGAASLAPGDYVLKLAASDGESVGSVEHAFHAALAGSSGVTLSDLIAGTAPGDTAGPRPPISSTAWYGTMQAYLESYGRESGRVAVRYEIAADDEQPAIAGADASRRPVGDERAIHTATLPVGMLPPGVYRLRARVTLPDGQTRLLSRAFTVPRLTAPATAATSPAETEARIDLAVSAAVLQPPFELRAALAPRTIGQFLDRWRPEVPVPAETSAYIDSLRAGALPAVPPAPRDNDPWGWFVRGVGCLQREDYRNAEENLKKAITDQADSTVPLVYLGATYAASGHDLAAAAAWTTALGGVDDVPEVFEWAAAALMRGHEIARAVDLLEEAVGRWPDDPRFARPLAVLYATLGRGDQAILQLERHLAATPDDVEALMLAVRWYYELHLAGRSAHPDDLARATRCAEAYERLGGTSVPLVKQWLQFLAQP